MLIIKMIFEEFIYELLDEGDSFDMNKLKEIYEVLNDSSLLFMTPKFHIIQPYNRIFQIFVNETREKEELCLNQKQIDLLSKIHSYLCLIFEIEDDFDNIDIHIRINYYKYNKFTYEIFEELVYYYQYIKYNNHQDLYVELWNKFLDLKKESIIKRSVSYYYNTNENLEVINKTIIDEYVSIFEPKSITTIKIKDKLSLFFLLLLDKV
jgi:hypothetical protein